MISSNNLMNTSFISNSSSNSSCITGITTDAPMFFEEEEEDYFYTSTTTTTNVNNNGNGNSDSSNNLLPYFSYSSTNDYYGDEPTMLFTAHSPTVPHDAFMNSTAFDDYEFNFNNTTTTPTCAYHYPKRQRISNQHLPSTTATTTLHAKNSIAFVSNGAVNDFDYPSSSHYDYHLPKQPFSSPSVPATTSNAAVSAAQNYPCGGYNGISGSNAKKWKNGCLSTQSVAARDRRRKISDKTQQLGKLIPGASKMSTAEMFHAAYKYIRFLQAQIGILGVMGSIEENNKRDYLTPALEILLRSRKVQEKLYLEEMCLVSKELFDDAVAKH